MWACNFAPTGWAACDGQLLPISQNTALFSLLGTFYGGDGKSTFALPDLQGRGAMQQGQGSGLSDYFLGQQAGSEAVTLLLSEIPSHTHNVLARNAQSGANPAPAPDQALSKSAGGAAYTAASANLTQMNPQAIGITGSSFPHNNMQPYLVLFFAIAMQGVFPPRP